MQTEVIKFDEFELDLGRYELRRRGQVLKLEKVPMELLILLAEREGQLVTREEIIQRVWGEEVFVDTRQGINTAVRKIRVALRDDPDQPRILQTVFGKGYRLVAPVTVGSDELGSALEPEIKSAREPETQPPRERSAVPETAPAPASPKAGPVEPRLARALFLLIQAGYLALYAEAFIHFPDIRRFGLPPVIAEAVMVTALVGAAVRLYLISAVAFNYPGSGRLFRQIFPGILILDSLWAASPLFLFNRLGELTLLFVPGFAFLPFSQRTLMLSAYGTGDQASDRGRAPQNRPAGPPG